MKKIIAICLLLNLIAGCLLSAKAQETTTPPTTSFTIGGYKYMCWDEPQSGSQYRVVITTAQNEIVHDLCCISAVYLSMYTRTVVVADAELGEYLIKMPPAANVYVITETKN